MIFEAHISPSLHYNGHFPGGSGLADTGMSPFWILLELMVTEAVLTTGATRRAKLQSKCHHQQTNTQFFYRPDAFRGLHYYGYEKIYTFHLKTQRWTILSLRAKNTIRSQWSSGSMSDCSARGPGIESRCGQLCLSHNHCDLQPWARAVCTLPAVPRSTQPSTLRGTVNEYQLSG